jgi:transcription termination/antitermination protein NusG
MNSAAMTELIPPIHNVAPVPDRAVRSSAAWHALWTRSHCEQLVHDQLAAKGFDLFLPKIDRWSRRGGLRHLIRVPIFPGYVFLHRAMDRGSYVEILKARGLVQVLGERWDRLAAVPDAEIDAIRRIVDAGVPALPHAFLREGQRVRITRGPLTDVEGILVRTKLNRGLLVVSVDLLRRSVAAHVDCTWVVPA